MAGLMGAFGAMMLVRIGPASDPDRDRILKALGARNWFWHITGGGCLSLVLLYIGAIVLAGIIGAAAAFLATATRGRAALRR
jgi:hypothetical protein